MSMEMGALCKELLKLRKKREGIEGEETAAWRRVYELADDIAGEGEAYRFLVTEQEKVIGRSIAISHRLDPVQLQAALTPDEWKKVTVTQRVLDPAKLETLIVDKVIDADKVAECESETRTARKLLGEPNKEERGAIAAAKKSG